MGRALEAHHLKRVPLLLPQEMVEWIDRKTKGVENRTTFIRRLIAKSMQEDKGEAN
jgi:metal-responsive CopG/Arc/MetJ family transcriptional regulator